MSMLGKLFDSSERFLGKVRPLVEKINTLEPDFDKLSDDELKSYTSDLRQSVTNGALLDSLIPEAFAIVREAAKRSLGQRPFDVQLLGGMALHAGKIAEMKTGEGKTLTATMPSYLNALSGQGVHIVTVNDYLAKRDKDWMGKIYNLLGQKVETLVENYQTAGIYQLQWEAADKPSGVYFYRLEANGFVQSRKMVLVK